MKYTKVCWQKLKNWTLNQLSVANILCHSVRWLEEDPEIIDIGNFLEYVREAVYNIEKR
jgi:hypothetical protein